VKEREPCPGKGPCAICDVCPDCGDLLDECAQGPCNPDDRDRALRILARHPGWIYWQPGRLLVFKTPLYNAPEACVALMNKIPSPFDFPPLDPTAEAARAVYIEARMIGRGSARLFVYAHSPTSKDPRRDVPA